MEYTLDQNLRDILSDKGLTGLPEELNSEEKRAWIEAIALVMRSNNTKSYVLMGRDKFGVPKIIKDYGGTSIIRKYLTFYPCSYLNPDNMPEFDNEDDKFTFLSNKYSMSISTIKSTYSEKDISRMLVAQGIVFQKQFGGEKTERVERKIDNKPKQKVEENGEKPKQAAKTAGRPKAVKGKTAK